MSERSMPDATLDDFKRIVLEADPNVPVGSDIYNAQLVMLASLKVGQSAEDLSAFSGIPINEVRVTVNRLCENGVWIGGEWVNFNPWSGEESGTDFNIATNIALGHMVFDPRDDMLRLTPKGLLRAETLIRGEKG